MNVSKFLCAWDVGVLCLCPDPARLNQFPRVRTPYESRCAASCRGEAPLFVAASGTTPRHVCLWEMHRKGAQLNYSS